MYVHNHNEYNKPMAIRITHLLKTQPARDFHYVRKMIQDILLGFNLPGLPAIRQDGSAGRLLYEIGKSCPGGHLPRYSTSNAVMQQMNPFHEYYKTCCMSLVELPSDGGRIHGKYLEKHWFYDNIKKAGCSMKLCGDEFGCSTRYGRPYVLIIGSPQGYQEVDRAVEMVKREMKKHQANCNCTL